LPEFRAGLEMATARNCSALRLALLKLVVVGLKPKTGALSWKEVRTKKKAKPNCK
jgi:hypothetical protein